MLDTKATQNGGGKFVARTFSVEALDSSGEVVASVLFDRLGRGRRSTWTALLATIQGMKARWTLTIDDDIKFDIIPREILDLYQWITVFEAGQGNPAAPTARPSGSSSSFIWLRWWRLLLLHWQRGTLSLLPAWVRNLPKHSSQDGQTLCGIMLLWLKASGVFH